MSLLVWRERAFALRQCTPVTIVIVADLGFRWCACRSRSWRSFLTAFSLACNSSWCRPSASICSWQASNCPEAHNLNSGACWKRRFDGGTHIRGASREPQLPLLSYKTFEAVDGGVRGRAAASSRWDQDGLVRRVDTCVCTAKWLVSSSRAIHPVRLTERGRLRSGARVGECGEVDEEGARKSTIGGHQCPCQQHEHTKCLYRAAEWFWTDSPSSPLRNLVLLCVVAAECLGEVGGFHHDAALPARPLAQTLDLKFQLLPVSYSSRCTQNWSSGRRLYDSRGVEFALEQFLGLSSGWIHLERARTRIKIFGITAILAHSALPITTVKVHGSPSLSTKSPIFAHRTLGGNERRRVTTICAD